MKQLTGNNNNEFFIDIFDWDLSDLFDNSFHSFIDKLLEESGEYINDLYPESCSVLSPKDSEKLFHEYTKLLWNLSSNKVKYYFYFNLKIFSKIMSILDEVEYNYIKKMIISFQTEKIIEFLTGNVIYRQFMLSFSKTVL